MLECLVRYRAKENATDYSRYVPSEKDEQLYKEMVSREIYRSSGKYHAGQCEMSATSKRNMKKGEKPEEKDRRWITSTDSNYRTGFKHFAIIYQEKKKKKLNMEDFTAFGTKDLIWPWDITKDVEKYQGTTANVKRFIIGAYRKIVESQMQQVDEHEDKFAVYFPDIENEERVAKECRNEVAAFQNRCGAILRLLTIGGKNIDIECRAKTKYNQETLKPALGTDVVPNPVEFLPKYFESAEVQAMDQKLLECASDEAPPVTGGELSDLAEKCLETICLKNGHRLQVPGKITGYEYIDALQSRPTFFPYQAADPGDTDDINNLIDPETGIQFVENRQEKDVPEEEKKSLQGFIVNIKAHKNAKQGETKLWLSRADILRIELFRAIAEKYANHNNLEYPINGPVFVNENLKEWVCDGTRTPRFLTWSKICDIPKFRSHTCRKMWSTYALSQKEMLIRELAAQASAHTIETQSRNYQTEAYKAVQAVAISQWYRNQCKIIEDKRKNDDNEILPFINESHAEKVKEDLALVKNMKDQRIMDAEEAEDEEERMSAKRTVTSALKYKAFDLVIKANDTLEDAWGINYPEEFMTAKPCINQKCKKNFLKLVDYASTTEYDTSIIMDHLMEFTGLLAPKNTESTDEQFIEKVENEWTKSIVRIFHRMKEIGDINSLRLKKLLAEFNISNQYKYTCGNEELKRTLEHYNDKQKREEEASNRLVNTDKSYNAEKARNLLAEGAKKLLEKRKDQQEQDHFTKLREQEQRSIIQAENETFCDDNQIGTPTKGSKVKIQEISEKDKVDGTPAKMRRRDSEKLQGRDGKTRHRNWTDKMKVQLLEIYIKSAPMPFQRGLTKEEREETISEMSKKTRLTLEDGSDVLLGDLSKNPKEHLTKLLCNKREGLSFDGKKKALLSYLDDKVEEKYGKGEWNRAMAVEVREDLLKDLYKRCGGERPDTRQDFEDLDETTSAQEESIPLEELPPARRKGIPKSKRPDDDPDYIDEDENKVERRKYRKTKTRRLPTSKDDQSNQSNLEVFEYTDEDGKIAVHPSYSDFKKINNNKTDYQFEEDKDDNNKKSQRKNYRKKTSKEEDDDDDGDDEDDESTSKSRRNKEDDDDMVQPSKQARTKNSRIITARNDNNKKSVDEDDENEELGKKSKKKKYRKTTCKEEDYDDDADDDGDDEDDESTSKSRRNPLRTSKAVRDLEKIRKVDEYLNIPDKDRDFEVFNAGNKGRGVRTTRRFKKDEILMEYKGEILNYKEGKERHKNYTEEHGSYLYSFEFEGKKYWCDATRNTEDFGRLINHGIKNANAKVKVNKIGERLRLVIKAIKTIEPKTEILYDYGEKDPTIIKENPWLKD